MFPNASNHQRAATGRCSARFDRSGGGPIESRRVGVSSFRAHACLPRELPLIRCTALLASVLLVKRNSVADTADNALVCEASVTGCQNGKRTIVSQAEFDKLQADKGTYERLEPQFYGALTLSLVSAAIFAGTF